MVKHLKVVDSLYRNEALLFRAVAEGDEHAFRVLFDRYKTKLHYLAIKMLKTPAVAEELVQDVFMNTWLNRDKFHSVDNPEAYFFTIAYNSIYRQLKKISRDRRLLRELVQVVQEIQYTTDEQVLAHESEALINLAIQELPPQRRAIFKLSRQQGLSHEEIAQQLNISRNTVKNQMVEALRHIRRYIGKASLLLGFLAGTSL